MRSLARGLVTAVVTGGTALAMALATVTPAAAAVPPNLNECPELGAGYHGGCVNELQTELNEVIDAELVVDGWYGPSTAAAVMTYQDAHGLTPDGIAGPEVKAALVDDLSVPSPTPGEPLAPEPEPTPEPKSGGLPVSFNCGIVTCSVYLSRSATETVAEVVEDSNPAGDEINEKACGMLAEATEVAAPVVFAACLAHSIWSRPEACLSTTRTLLVNSVRRRG